MQFATESLVTQNNKLLSSHQQKHITDAHSANNVCKGSETFPISNNNQYVVTQFSIHQQLTLLMLYWLLLDVAEDQILQDYKVSQETQWHASSRLHNKDLQCHY